MNIKVRRLPSKIKISVFSRAEQAVFNNIFDQNDCLRD